VRVIGLKELRLHLERKSSVFRLLGQKLIFEMVHGGLTSLFTNQDSTQKWKALLGIL
jgi:hypothetical protein